MCDQPTKRLFRRQTFVSVDRDGRVADRESFSEVGFIGRPTSGRLYGLRIVRYRMAQAVLIAADEGVGSHDSSPMNEKAGSSPGLCILRLVVLLDPLRDPPLKRRAAMKKAGFTPGFAI
jgi:hypothetical protein